MQFAKNIKKASSLIWEYQRLINMPKVEVDPSKCNGDGVCIDVCPVEVFELQDLPENSDSKKSVPVKADECILCMACVTSCPTEAITVEE